MDRREFLRNIGLGALGLFVGKGLIGKGEVVAETLPVFDCHYLTDTSWYLPETDSADCILFDDMAGPFRTDYDVAFWREWAERVEERRAASLFNNSFKTYRKE